MSFATTIGSFLLGGNSGFFLLFVIPIVLLVGILWVCKKFNFSLMPDGLQGDQPLKFKFPKISREKQGRMYKWDVTDAAIEDLADDDDFAEDDDDDEDDRSSVRHRRVADITSGGLYD